MKILKNRIISKIIKDPYFLFVSVFPFVLSFNLAFHLFDEFSYIGNYYSNYYQIYIHLTDIWLLSFFLWGGIKNLKNGKILGWKYVLILGVFLFFRLIPDFDFYNIYFSLRIFLYISSCWIIFNSIPLTSYYLYLFLNIFVLSGLFQSILAILQFFRGRMLGLSFLGESVIQLGGYSASCVNLGDSMYLRAYGTFPHPNILGGFLVFSVFSSILLIFKVKKLKFKIIYSFFSCILILSLILTWSRSCWLALFLLALLWLIYDFNIVKNLIIKYWYLVVSIFILVLVLGLLPNLLFRINISQILISDSFNERLELLRRAWVLIKTYPIFGIGGGNFVRELMKDPLYTSGQIALLQPVHNVPVLILTEFGSLFLLGLVFILCKIIKQFKNSKVFWSVFIILFVTGMLDHYLYTLPQGLGLLVAVAFLVRANYAKIPVKSVDGICHSGGSERTF